MKFSALNVDFKSASQDPIGTQSPPNECIKYVQYDRCSAPKYTPNKGILHRLLDLGTPFKTRDFCYYRLM